MIPSTTFGRLRSFQHSTIKSGIPINNHVIKFDTSNDPAITLKKSSEMTKPRFQAIDRAQYTFVESRNPKRKKNITDKTKMYTFYFPIRSVTNIFERYMHKLFQPQSVCSKFDCRQIRLGSNPEKNGFILQQKSHIVL